MILVKYSLTRQFGRQTAAGLALPSELRTVSLKYGVMFIKSLGLQGGALFAEKNNFDFLNLSKSDNKFGVKFCLKEATPIGNVQIKNYIISDLSVLRNMERVNMSS